MKLKFERKYVEHRTGTKIVHNTGGDESLLILQRYIGSEVGQMSLSEHLEAIRKIRNKEINGWGDGGNLCSSWITKDGVIIEDDYIYPPDNILSLNLDQFEAAIVGWKKFISNENLLEYEIDI